MSGDMSVTVDSGETFDVREVHIQQALSSLFDVTLNVVSDNPDIDFEAVIGRSASFTLHGRAGGGDQPRTWSGLAAELHQIAVEPTGLSTYRLRIVPYLFRGTRPRSASTATRISGCRHAAAVERRLRCVQSSVSAAVATT